MSCLPEGGTKGETGLGRQARVQGDSRIESYSPAWLEGKKIISLSSIGNPADFEETLERLGADVIERIRFRDHHRYSSRDLERIGKKAKLMEAEAIVTTEKDEVRLVNTQCKISNAKLTMQNYYVLRVEMKITKGEDVLWKMMDIE